MTFVAGREIYRLENIQRFTKSRIRRAKDPDRRRGGRETRDGLRRGAARDAGERRIQAARRVARSRSSSRIIRPPTLRRPSSTCWAKRRRVAGRRSGKIARAELAAHLPDPRRAERRERSRDDGEAPRPARTRIARPERPNHPARARRRERSRTSREWCAWRSMSGRAHGVEPGDFVGVIAGVTAIPKGEIGAIHLQATKSLVDVAATRVDLVLEEVERDSVQRAEAGGAAGCAGRETSVATSAKAL